MGVTLSPVTTTARPALDLSGSTSTVYLRLSTQDLLCVTEAQPQRNLFKAGNILPGNVLKGALATHLAHLGADPAKNTPATGPLRSWRAAPEKLSRRLLR